MTQAAVAKGAPFSHVLGYALLLFGFVAAPYAACSVALGLTGPAIYFAAGWVVDVLESWQPLELGTAAALLVASPACVLAGWTLASGRKRLVLFLRRFGNEKLNDAVRDLVQSRFRRRLRLVTLDDSAFSPLGPHWRGLWLSLLPGAVVLGLLALVYPGFAKLTEGEIRGEGLFASQFYYFRLGLEWVAYAVTAAVVLLVVAALRSHFTARTAISDDRAIARVTRRLRRLCSMFRAPSIAAPMATVVTVADSQWQAAVTSIAAICEVALIDVSTPRESIRWELATLRQRGTRIILLAQRDLLAQWWADPRVHDDPELAAELRRLAADLPLVTYEAPSRLDQTALVALV